MTSHPSYFNLLRWVISDFLFSWDIVVGGEIDALWVRYEVMRQDYEGLDCISLSHILFALWFGLTLTS